MMKLNKLLTGWGAINLALLLASHDCISLKAKEISPAQMQAIYDEARTPFKYGIVIRPPHGKRVDCPSVFRCGDRWFMAYVQLENLPDGKPLGYSTQLAVSTNLLDCQSLGTILSPGASNAWDAANAGGGIALMDTTWGGSGTLEKFDDKYWLAYIGGKNPGYETPPLATGMAFTADPSQPCAWQKLPAPVQQTTDADARDFETVQLYKATIIHDPAATLGASFVMFRNACGRNLDGKTGDEKIGVSISQDMKTWKRIGTAPVLAHARIGKGKAITGDPQIVRMHNLWVMFYFGADWKPGASGAFDTFAASRDLVHWTDWTGSNLIDPSEPWDKTHAHKPWLIKYHGIVYHFYCAVGDQGRVIALATSKAIAISKPARR